VCERRYNGLLICPEPDVRSNAAALLRTAPNYSRSVRCGKAQTDYGGHLRAAWYGSLSGWRHLPTLLSCGTGRVYPDCLAHFPGAKALSCTSCAAHC